MKKLLFSSFPAFSRPPLTGKYSLTAWHKNMWNKTRQKLLEKSFKFMHCPLFKKNIHHSSSSFKFLPKFEFMTIFCFDVIHPFTSLTFLSFYLISSSSSKHRCTETLFTGVRALLFLGRGRLDFSGA